MLVLTRKVGETLVINENIRVSVQRIRGNRVTIGIDAPDDVSIVRGELCFEMGDVNPSSNEEPAPSGNEIDIACAS